MVTGHFFESAKISPDLTAFNKYFRSHYEKMLQEQLELNKGARAYIDRLKQEGKRCGVVSSAATWMVDNILESLNLRTVFDIIITQDHVTKHKPDPEAYELALSKLSASPYETIIFEDSTAGLNAGRAAGCEVIAFRHNFNVKNDLSSAIKVIENYEEMFL